MLQRPDSQLSSSVLPFRCGTSGASYLRAEVVQTEVQVSFGRTTPSSRYKDSKTTELATTAGAPQPQGTAGMALPTHQATPSPAKRRAHPQLTPKQTLMKGYLELLWASFGAWRAHGWGQSWGSPEPCTRQNSRASLLPSTTCGTIPRENGSWVGSIFGRPARAR